MRHKKNILKHTLSMGFATYVSQALGLVTSIAMRGFLGPAAIGIWTIIQVILGYCGYASFGTTRAMARDYPIARGGGEHEKAEHLKDLTVTFSMAMSVIPLWVIGVFTFWKWAQLENAFRIGLVFICFFLFVQRFYDLVLTLLRSDKRFDVLSRVTICNAVGMLAMIFIFVKPFKIYGLMLGSAVVTLMCLWYMLKRQPYRFRWFWDNGVLFQQLKLGLPLLAIAFLGTFYKSLDKLLIAKHLGFEDVGLYSIAMMVTSLVYAFPMMLSNVLYPNMLAEYGKSGKSSTALTKYLHKPVIILSILVPVLCGAVFFLFPLVVDRLLPKFIPGIPAMKIYLISILFMLIAQFSTNILTAMDKYWVNIPILLMALALNAGLNFLLIRSGFGIVGVASGTTLSFIAYGMTTFIVATRYLQSLCEALRHAVVLLSICIAIFGGIWGIDRLLFNHQPGILGILLKCSLFGVYTLPFFFYLEKKISFVGMLRSTFSAKGPRADNVSEE